MTIRRQLFNETPIAMFWVASSANLRSSRCLDGQNNKQNSTSMIVQNHVGIL